AWCHRQVGQVLARLKRFPEALTALNAAVAIWQKLGEADPKNTGDASNLGGAHARRGWALVRAGQRAEAAGDLHKALELYAKIPHADGQFERALALALLAGLGADAKSGVTKDEAKTFADQSVAALADLVKAGWAWPSEVKEPDF